MCKFVMALIRAKRTFDVHSKWDSFFIKDGNMTLSKASAFLDMLPVQGAYYKGVLKPKNRNKLAWNPKTSLNFPPNPKTVEICKTAPELNK